MDPNKSDVHDDFVIVPAKGLPDEAFEEEAKSLIASGARNPRGVEALRAIYKSSGWPGVYRVSLQHRTASWDKDHWHFNAFRIADFMRYSARKTQLLTGSTNALSFARG